MTPDKGSIHVNRPLGNLSLGFLQESTAFACYRALHFVPSDKQGNSYYRYKIGHWNRDAMQKRAPGAETAGIGYEVDTASFFCHLWGLHHDVPDQNRANQDEPLNEDEDAANLLAQVAAIRWERAFATSFMTTGVWWRDVTGHSSTVGETQVLYWSSVNSDPVKDIAVQQTAILKRTGKKPNVLVLGKETWDKGIKSNAAVLARMVPGQTGLSGRPSEVTKAQFAALCELDEVIVSEAVYNSAQEGATDAMDFIVGKHALLLYKPTRPGRFVAAPAYFFVWTGYTGMTSMGYRMKKFRMEANASDRIEIETAFDPHLVHNGLAVFFSAVVQ